MPIPRTTAQRLLSETEFRLINESFPPTVSTLSDKGLLQRMERVRKARDKYHSMVERQQGKSASGTQRSAAPSANLKEVISKEKIFDETLARFERQTAKAGGGTSTKAMAKPARALTGKKSSSEKAGSQGTSKASVKMANKAAAKSGAKTGTKTATKSGTTTGIKAEPKGKGTGGTRKATPRGRHGALTPSTTLH
ncbi:hypothetical protein GCM10027343_38640 [Noviherbaspirillum agri]